jgi:hypothetical protein
MNLPRFHIDALVYGASEGLRTLVLEREAPYTAAASPAGPPPMIAVSYTARRGCVCRPSSPASSRVAGRLSTVPSTRRNAGHSRSVGHVPGQRAASSGASGAIQSWLI